MFGQTDDAKVLRPLKTSVDDYIPLLNSCGYKAFTFDLSSLSDGQYSLSFKIREYEDGKVVLDDLLNGYCCGYLRNFFVSSRLKFFVLYPRNSP